MGENIISLRSNRRLTVALWHPQSNVAAIKEGKMSNYVESCEFTPHEPCDTLDMRGDAFYSLL